MPYQVYLKELKIGETFTKDAVPFLVLDVRFNEVYSSTVFGITETHDRYQLVTRIPQLDFLRFERTYLEVNEDALVL